MRTRSINSTAFARAALRDIPRCTSYISPSCAPTETTGFSADSASWKIIAICAPRTLRRASRPIFSRSSPLKSTSPPVTNPGGVSRMPITACAVTDFPDPDSPSTARVSPASTL